MRRKLVIIYISARSVCNKTHNAYKSQQYICCNAQTPLPHPKTLSREFSTHTRRQETTLYKFNEGARGDSGVEKKAFKMTRGRALTKNQTQKGTLPRPVNIRWWNYESLLQLYSIK